MSSILPSGRAITRKAAFDTWDASITKVSDIVAEFECHSDVLHPLCTPEHTLDGDLSQKLSPSHPGMSLEEAYRHLDEKMVELEKIEQRMMRARRELLGLRNSSLHLVPANKLLPEILSYIFLLGVEQAEYDLDMAESDSESEEGEPALDPIPFNLLVSQVCRRWRTIAINTATLWTHIDFSDHPPHNLTRLFLARSKGAILGVNLTLTDIDDLESEAHITEGMDILGEHVSKIGSLTVDAATDMQLDLLLTAFLQRCEPQPGTHDQTRAALRKLKLVDVSGSGYALTPNISRERLPFVFQTLRGLDDVTLEGTSLPWHSPAFEGLKRLHLVGLGTDALPFEDEFVNIIQNCPLLEKLKLEEAGLTLENSSDIVKMRRQTHPIDLHRLDSLHLSTLSWNEMEFILHLINAPNLKSLWIDTPTESVNPDGTIVDEGQEIEGLPRDEHVLKTVAVFINRSQADTFESSSLHTLHIESFDTTITADDDTNPHLMEVLKAVPNLNTLELCEIAVGDVVLESLSAVTPTPSVPGSPSKPPSKAPSMSTSISSIVSEQIPSPSIYPPPTSFAQYEFDEDDDDDEDWADEDTMEVDHDSSTPHQDHIPSPRPKKIIPICPSLQVLKLELIHDITREALRVVLANRNNRGMPLILKLSDMFGEVLEELQVEFEPLCRSLSIQHDGNIY